MSETRDPTGPAPETRSLNFLLLLFGAGAAPVFWLGQTMLGYGVSAQACYAGDHPQGIASGSTLSLALQLFNAAAITAALAGGAAAWWCWRHVQTEKKEAVDFRIGEGRVRFLALWGIFSSLCFLLAILFNIFGSLTVPPCLT